MTVACLPQGLSVLRRVMSMAGPAATKLFITEIAVFGSVQAQTVKARHCAQAQSVLRQLHEAVRQGRVPGGHHGCALLRLHRGGLPAVRPPPLPFHPLNPRPPSWLCTATAAP